MITLKQAETALRFREPFNAGNLSARISGGVYEVFSYYTLIAVSAPDRFTDFAEVMPEKYSVTTSKHQNIVRRAWGLI